MNETYKGQVIWFSKLGIGFIDWSKDGVKQADLFVHYSDINAEGFKMLHKGDNVTFEIGLNHKNQPKAINVTVQK